jgi:hypothetical protein
MTSGLPDITGIPLISSQYQYHQVVPESYELYGVLEDDRMDYFLQSAGMMDAKIRIMKRWRK